MKMASTPQNYVVSFKGKQADLFDYAGRIVRRFTAQAEIVNAQVNGSGKDATIAITMKDGKFIIYKSTGQVVKRG